MMRLGETPGKFVEKYSGRRVEGEVERWVKVEDGAKSVQVKVWEEEGMAMNIWSEPGQMWRWWGEMANALVEEAGIWNSHHSVSM